MVVCITSYILCLFLYTLLHMFFTRIRNICICYVVRKKKQINYKKKKKVQVPLLKTQIRYFHSRIRVKSLYNCIFSYNLLTTFTTLRATSADNKLISYFFKKIEFEISHKLSLIFLRKKKMLSQKKTKNISKCLLLNFSQHAEH